ncbi:atp-dependent RNA helicase ddx42 [Anaeramoeba ignava]|uniref:RNA helicase n=1 Tax=Anaeramoeba ignava TaxID=1746090 RepID=A0A9Q0LQG1_ANAIG|nr:atp-dependent RNA helicase ddx42 [Anaeramoeba ignava]
MSDSFEDKYFADEDEKDQTSITNFNQNDNESSSESEDALDKFMNDLEKDDPNKKNNKEKQIRNDIDEIDEIDSYLHLTGHDIGISNLEPHLKNENFLLQQKSEFEIEFDSDDNPIVDLKSRKKAVVPLDEVNHSEIEYFEFNKNFYQENPQIATLSDQEVKKIRNEKQIRVSAFDVPKPVLSFQQCGFSSLVLNILKKMNIVEPTPIQSQAIPAILSGRDVYGIAKTGSGKTLAYVLPLIIHCLDQPHIQKGDGPISVILVPTRELAHQVYLVTTQLAKPHNLIVKEITGGIKKYEQTKELKKGCEIIVATPGRLIDQIRLKGTNLLRCTYLVLDEADKMFDFGFESQVMSIVQAIRPDRQILLFCATTKRAIENLVRDQLADYVRITIGKVGVATQNVVQNTLIFKNIEEKKSWLFENLPNFLDSGTVLIFVTSKELSEQLAIEINDHGFRCGALHGDLSPYDRNIMVKGFQKGNISILVATDIFSRGVDIRSIKTVVNFEVARDVNTHVNRVGRTGRAGDKGVAYNLIMESESNFAAVLFHSLKLADQEVPEKLLEIAMQNKNFRKNSIQKLLSHKKKPKQTGKIKEVLDSWKEKEDLHLENEKNETEKNHLNFQKIFHSARRKGNKKGIGFSEISGRKKRKDKNDLQINIGSFRSFQNTFVSSDNLNSTSKKLEDDLKKPRKK